MRKIAILLLLAGLSFPAIRFGSYLYRQGKKSVSVQASACKVDVKLVWEEKGKKKALLLVNGRELALPLFKSARVGRCRVKFVGVSGEKVIIRVNGRTIKN